MFTDVANEDHIWSLTELVEGRMQFSALKQQCQNTEMEWEWETPIGSHIFVIRQLSIIRVHVYDGSVLNNSDNVTFHKP